MRTIIINGFVIDGSGQPAKRADLLLDHEKITAVIPCTGMLPDQVRPSAGPPVAAASRMQRGSGLPYDADLLIDAAGLTVTPGFIDVHRHGDLAVLRDMDYGELELAQGITSVVNGNCGLSLVPSAPATHAAWLQYLEPCLGQAPDDCTVMTYADSLAVAGTVPLRINVATLVGTGAIRMSLKGFSRSPFSASERSQATACLDSALEQGAPGASCGLIYVPDAYTTKNEFARLLKPLAVSNKILSCHMRGEGNSLLDAVSEILSIGAQAGIRLNISHFKSVGIKNWQKMIDPAIQLIERSGQDVTADFYPYLGGSTTLMTLLPPSVIRETLEQTLNRISGKTGSAFVRSELQKSHPGWDSMVEAIGWDRILISALENPAHASFPGLSMAEIANRCGVDPVELLCDLLIKEKGSVSVISMSMSQVDCDRIARLPWSMLISDALYSSAGKPHPRLYGAFARAIHDLVYQRQVLSLEEAVRKMTSQPANRFNLQKRGLVQEGFFADLCLFDPAALKDRATYEEPRRQAEGMDVVLVNGCIARLADVNSNNTEKKTHAGQRLLCQ
ncbi:MAG: amidohydrolase family protein [Ruminococcaceae bacterium]|nr:amidohydrolase family protein [Oscillospiraceae bacterium]